MSIVVTGANRHDVTQVETVLKSRIRKPRGRTQQNLCADAGYSGEKSKNIMHTYHYTPHIRPRGEEKIAIQPILRHDTGLLKSFIHGSTVSENFLYAMKKQMSPTNRYYNSLQVLSFLENQALFRDKFLNALTNFPSDIFLYLFSLNCRQLDLLEVVFLEELFCACFAGISFLL